MFTQNFMLHQGTYSGVVATSVSTGKVFSTHENTITEKEISWVAVIAKVAIFKWIVSKILNIISSSL